MAKSLKEKIQDIPATSCGVVTPYDTINKVGLIGSGFEN